MDIVKSEINMANEVELCVEVGSNIGDTLLENADINQLCRTCANTHDNMIPIFEGDGLEHDLQNKIDKHFPVNISKDDGLPNKMCFQCASTLVAWHDMFTGCIEAEKKLKHLLNKVKDGQIGETVFGSSVVSEDSASDNLKAQQKTGSEMEIDNDDGNDDDYAPEHGGDDDDEDDDDDEEEEEDEEDDDLETEVVLHKLDAKEKEKTVEVSEKGTTIRDQDTLEMLTARNREDSSPERQNSIGTSLRNRKHFLHEKQLRQKIRSDCSIENTSNAVIPRIEHGFDDNDEIVIDLNNYCGAVEKLDIQVSHKPISISVVDGMFRIIVDGFVVDGNSTDIFNPSFICCLCLENTDATNLALHCKIHNVLRVTDSCKLCSLNMDVGQLKNHLNMHQLFLEPVICENLIQYKFGCNESLRRESISDSVVGKIPVFKCFKCKKLFPAENDLQVHVENNKCVQPHEQLKISNHNVPISFKPVEVFKKQDSSYRIAIRGFMLCLNESEDSETFKCCLCLQKMSTANLVSHIKSHNPLKASDECKVCFTKCNSINELKKHLTSHNYFLRGVICQDLNDFQNKSTCVRSENPIPVTGENTDDSMTKFEELECEMPIFKCMDCSKILLDYEDVENHKKEHNTAEMHHEDTQPSTSKPAYEILQEPENSDVLKVIVNGFMNKTFGTINLSVDNSKELASQIICCICLKEVSAINIASHCDSHYPLKASDYCQVCSLRFEETLILEKHLIEHKLVLDALICKNLDEFNTKITELSVKDMKDLIPGFKCDLCGMIFLSERNLQNHIDSSTCISYVQPIHFLKESETDMELAIYGYLNSRCGEANEASSYTCCICLEDLRCKDSILLHFKLHYPLKATDSCKLCNFSSDSVDMLERHLSRHSVPLNVMDLAVSTDASHSGEQIQEISNFLNASDLQIASNTIPEDKVKCVVCETIFTDECMFKKHFQCGKCIKFKTYACRECGKNFNKQKQLKEHMKTHSSTYSLCHICGTNIKTRGMRRHVRTVHERWEATQLQNNANKVICKICGVSVSKYVLNQHLATHFFNRNYKCNTCDKTFTHKISLKVHLKTHAATQMTYKCEICSDTFKRRDHVVAHKARIHNIVRAKNHKCDVCGKHFSTSNTLHVHKRTHLESQNYQCLECKVIFSSGMGLKNHQSQTRHEGVEIISSGIDEHHKVNRFVCKICGQRYGSMASLKGHENTHNDSNKKEGSPSLSYECPECHRNYSSQRSLELHIIMTNHAVHRKKWKRNSQQAETEKKPVERNFACNICESRFLKLFHLKKHRLKLKHFLVCSLCNDSTVIDLDKHNRENHTSGENSSCNITYNCSECPKKFKKLKMLDNHISLKHTKQPNAPAKDSSSERESIHVSNIIVVKAIKRIPLPIDEFTVS